MDEKMKAKILIVEDEMIIAKSLEKSLTKTGFAVVGISTNYEDGIKKDVQ